MKHTLLLAGLALLLTSCAWNSTQHGGYDGMRSAQWGAGIPFIALRFDKARYLTDAEYRDAFDRGLMDSRPVMRHIIGDGRQQVRELLRLDELRAQAEAHSLPANGRPDAAPALVPAATTIAPAETRTPVPEYVPGERAPSGLSPLGGDGVVIYRIEVPSLGEAR